VRKLRGHPSLPGTHRFQIDRTGITVFPRLEALVVEPLQQSSTDRAAFDLAGLDSMLNGGLNPGTLTLLMGMPGTGKTTVGLQFLLAGIAAGEAGLLVTMHETADQLLNKASAFFGEQLHDAVDGGQLHILRRAAVELDVDELATSMREMIMTRSVRRLVFDGVDLLQRVLAQESRDQDFFAAIAELCRGRQVTSIFVLELPWLGGNEFDAMLAPFVVLGENIVVLRQVEHRNQLRRTISVVKMRFSDHDRTTRELLIRETGLEVAATIVGVKQR